MIDPGTWTATMSARLFAAGVAKPLADAMRRRSVRWRVAWSVSRSAKSHGIVIRWNTLRKWLARADVQQQLIIGSGTELESCLHSLATLMPGQGADSVPGARTILKMALDQYLRKLPISDAVAVGNRWTSEQIVASESRIIRVLSSDPAQLDEALGRLHPWRRAEAREIASRWPRLSELVHSIVTSTDRAILLRDWGQSPPVQLVDAPAEAWVWLGIVSADYGEGAASVTFLTSAIERGAGPANYLWARLGQITMTDDGEVAEARAFLQRSEPKHALAAALLMMMDANFDEADKVLTEWAPTTSADRAIRQSLRVNCAAARGEFNAAIALGIDGAAKEPDSSGLNLRTAEQLLSRGQHGPTDDRLADFELARALAIRARDSRRMWKGDSSAAVLVAMKAAVLSNDIERGWRLTRPPPDGEANAVEEADSRVRAESAILAAMTGRNELAAEIAAEQGSVFVTATVEGFAAHGAGDPTTAGEAWMRAWDAAPDDMARSQTLAALAQLGGPWPDLTDFELAQPEAARSLRSVHKIMSIEGTERLRLLRARAHESSQLTVLLAEELLEQGDVRGSAAALESGAARWSDAFMMRMAAARYLQAGDYPKADENSAKALAFGGTEWAGALEALMIRFDSLEGQGLQDESLLVARQLLKVAPDNIEGRWVFIHCSARHGDLDSAWNALTYQGEPISPRGRADADIWITLVAKYDNSPLFFSRALSEMRRWKDDPDVGGRFLMQIYLGLDRRGVELSEENLADLHSETEAFTRDHPDSKTFRSVPLGTPDDPLAPFEELLRANAENPALLDARSKVERGELPLGFLTRMSGAGYTEAALKRAAGRVYSHALEPRATIELTAARNALTQNIVVDPTTAVTLALLHSELVDRLIGAFGSVTTTDPAFRDALAAQHDASLHSTMSVTWDVDTQRTRPVEIAEEVAAKLASHADLTVDILTRVERRGWSTLQHYTNLPEGAVWLSAADYAVSKQLPLWCDDRVLREMVEAEGISTFGTVDLLRALVSEGKMDLRLAQAAESTLTVNYHVDLGFDAEVMRLASQIVGWETAGPAHALTRPATWEQPEKTLAFCMEACAATHVVAPDKVQRWIQAAAIGLIRIQPTEAVAAAANLRALLERAMSQPWMRPDILLFVISGIREAIAATEPIEDPFEAVMRQTYQNLAASQGWSYAGEFLVVLVRQLTADDRRTTVRVVLTTNT